MSGKRPTFEAFKAKALQRLDVRDEYEALSAVFNVKRRMIALRKQAGVTQEQMAKLLGTKKSNISRLESLNTESSPRLATIEDYAQALGYAVKVEFEPRTRPEGG